MFFLCAFPAPCMWGAPTEHTALYWNGWFAFDLRTVFCTILWGPWDENRGHIALGLISVHTATILVWTLIITNLNSFPVWSLSTSLMILSRVRSKFLRVADIKGPQSSFRPVSCWYPPCPHLHFNYAQLPCICLCILSAPLGESSFSLQSPSYISSLLGCFPQISPGGIRLVHLCIRIALTYCFPGGLVGRNPPANAGDTISIPGSGISLGGGNGNPLQYSCLGNSKDRGAWRVTAWQVAKCWTQLSNWALAYYSTCYTQLPSSSSLNLSFLIWALGNNNNFCIIG